MPPDFGGPHEAGYSLVVLAVLHVVRAGHEEAVGGLVGVGPEHFLDVVRVDLVHLDDGQLGGVQDVGDGCNEGDLLDGELLYDGVGLFQVVLNLELLVLAHLPGVGDGPTKVLLLCLFFLHLLLQRIDGLLLLLVELLEIHNVPHILEEVHLLVQVVVDDDDSLGLVLDVEPAAGVQTDRNPVLEFVKNLTGGLDVPSLQDDNFLGRLDAGIIDLVHEVLEVLLPELDPFLVDLLLLAPQPVGLQHWAVLLVGPPVLDLVLSAAVGAELALAAHVGGLLAAILAVLGQAHWAISYISDLIK